MAEGKYGQYILTELIMNEKPDVAARYSEFATRILWMDEKNTPGSFQINCSWYFRPPKTQMGDSHHHDVPEIIGLIGSDYTNPHNMNTEVEFWMEDEKFTINRSCMIFIPPGIKHCPLILKRIDKPVFHFSVVTSPLYSRSG
ncbi:MAG: hypothetical protein JXA46_14745 [Dehalococcoidales bacterium]|nr:hypothetical protein [Dehalococcoidales bacterium]